MSLEQNIDAVFIEKIGALTTAATEIKQEGDSFHLLIPAGFSHKTR